MKDVKDNKYASTLFNGLSLIQQNDIIGFYVDYIQYLNPYNKLDLLMKIHNNKFISKEHKNKISFDSTLDSIIQVCEYLISISNEMKNDKDNNNNDNSNNNTNNNNENSIDNNINSNNNIDNNINNDNNIDNNIDNNNNITPQKNRNYKRNNFKNRVFQEKFFHFLS